MATLFLIAFRLDRWIRVRKDHSFYRWIYALSIPVYCTAWTYYGSVGKAVDDDWEFLTIYIGPILSMPLWLLVVRKIVRICQEQRIATLPDFLALRYGKSLSVSVISSIFIVLGIIPYISIQLKSITDSYKILSISSQQSIDSNLLLINDFAFYLTIILAVIIVFFVFRSIESTDKHFGLMSAIAMDSIVKLIIFLTLGIYVTYVLFDGFGDIFALSQAEAKDKFYNTGSVTSIEWMVMLLLSMSAILLLPRQFQVAVAENTNVNHLKTVVWFFPAYLLLINVFVVPIALAGILILPESVAPDTYVLAIPIFSGQDILALVVFLGGFSAAVSMIVVSVIALSMITSNSLILPLVFKSTERLSALKNAPLKSRKWAVFFILMLAYLYYRYISEKYTLVSIGLISFVAMAQFVPSTLGAIYWLDANKTGTLLGIIFGFIIWFYALVFPTIIEIGVFSKDILINGPFGIAWLKPESLFGSSLSPIVNGTFWSLFLNFSAFCIGSIVHSQSPKEKNVAKLFVNVDEHSKNIGERVAWQGHIIHKDLVILTENLLGRERSQEIIKEYENWYGSYLIEGETDVRFVNFIERHLSAVVGSASARILISSIAKEEEIEINDVLQLLKETNEVSQLNTQLKVKTQELESANQRLENIDKEKDDFISTVTHELRTPLTSIKAFVEILQDNPDIEEADHFLGTINEEIDRMTRLINQVLDMEKLESGALTISKEPVKPFDIWVNTSRKMQHLINVQNVSINTIVSEQFKEASIFGDKDRLQQVFVNLLGNSIKYSSSKQKSVIDFEGRMEDKHLIFAIRDNGNGIKPENLPNIFDKFFQARDQTLKKPKGTGLGLAITKKIVELHEGTIEVISEWEVGSTFTIKLPKP